MRTFLYWQIRLLIRPILAPWAPVWLQRAWTALGGMTIKGPRGIAVTSVDMSGVPGHRITPAGSQAGRATLYLHGGGYVIGGLGSHGKIAAHVAHAASSTVFFPDYRLAPEHPFPAALDDALAAYRWLLAQKPAQLVVAGDSAGGGLALALAMSIRDAGLPPPAALVLISPFTDLTLAGASHASHAQRDPMLRRSWLAACAALYAGAKPQTDPLLSPAFGDLSRLPRMLILVGSEEILLSDAEQLAHAAQQAGTAATLRCQDGLWHDFPLWAGMLPQAQTALAEVGPFLEAAHA